MLVLRCQKTFPGLELDLDMAFDAPVVCVFGPSGCGKTTLLRLVAGLTDPEEGEISFDGEVLFSRDRGIKRPPQDRPIAYLPQDLQLFPHLNVQKNLLYGYKRTPPSQRRIAPDEVIELLRLKPLLDKSTDGLSGGEAQRVALGRALLSSPRLLLMDEPLASLDTLLADRILRYLQKILGRFQIHSLFVTHSAHEVFSIAEKVLVMSQGKALAFGDPEEVFDDPRAYAMIARQGFENVFWGTATAREGDGPPLVRCRGFDLDPGPVEGLTPGARARARIHGRNIILSLEKPRGISARNVLPAVVKRLSDAGEHVLVHLDAGESVIVELTPRAVRDLGIAPGKKLYWITKAHSIKVEVIDGDG